MATDTGWKLKRDSETKMIVWFKDGNVRTFYSIDWKHRYSQEKSKEQGLSRFYKKIKEYGILAGTIEIYETSTGVRIAKFYEGIPK